MIPTLATACSHPARRSGVDDLASLHGRQSGGVLDRGDPYAQIRRSGYRSLCTASFRAISRFSRISSMFSAGRMPQAVVADTAVTNPTFVVYGVATDYCVLAAVNGLLERQCRVAVVADAVRAIDHGAEVARFSTIGPEGGVLFTMTRDHLPG